MSRPVRLNVKWWMAPLAILAVSALAVAAILVLKPKFGESQAAAPTSTKWDTACAGALASDFNCFKRHYEGLVSGSGVGAAMADMKDGYEKSGYVKGNCHQLVHVVGRAAGDRYGDVAKAYEQGDDFCWSGFYHGVMESVINKVGYDQIKNKLNTICAGVSAGKQYSFHHYNCVHGLGHGVMAINNGELFEALRTCDSLTDSWERESCFGGVFMENIMSEINPDHKTKYLKKDDLIYPCNAVDRVYKQQCFLMQTSHALQVTGYDFKRTFGLCDNVELEFRATCYQSLGRDASGNSISDPVRTRDTCMLGRDFDARSNCIIGAAKDFVAYFHSNEQGEKLCAVLEPSLRDTCMATVKSTDVGGN